MEKLRVGNKIHSDRMMSFLIQVCDVDINILFDDIFVGVSLFMAEE